MLSGHLNRLTAIAGVSRNAAVPSGAAIYGRDRTLADTDAWYSVGHVSDIPAVSEMPRRANTYLTDKSIMALPPPAADAAITYDAVVPGFGIRVTKKGRTLVRAQLCRPRPRATDDDRSLSNLVSYGDM